MVILSSASFSDSALRAVRHYSRHEASKDMHQADMSRKSPPANGIMLGTIRVAVRAAGCLRATVHCLHFSTPTSCEYYTLALYSLFVYLRAWGPLTAQLPISHIPF